MMLQVEQGGQQLTSESPVHPLRTDASSGVGNSSAQTVDDHVLVEGTEKVSEHSVITQRTIYNYLVVCWIFCIFK